MIIHFLVHDGVMEVGHTRAMMEVLRLMAKRDEVKKIKLICLHASTPEVLLPDNPEKLEITTLPGKNLKPFLIKSLFFQIYTWLFKKSLIRDEGPVITMGVCSFIGNIVNIQFYHQDWEKLYFKYNKGGWFKNLYKTIFLRYLSLCEDIYYRRKNLKFVFLSEFIAKSVSTRYQLNPNQSITAYSSVNFKEFLPPQNFSDEDQNILLSEMQQTYPILTGINSKLPILLFVGAFERKGLPFLLKHLPDNVNFIVVGKGEAHSSFKLPKRHDIFPIEYTTEIAKFYLLSDAFLFPTHYEPFGLVVTEAVASGTRVFVTADKVGASEIIQDLPGIDFINTNDEDVRLKEDLNRVEKLTSEKRIEWARQRQRQLSQYTWELCEQQWWQLITNE